MKKVRKGPGTGRRALVTAIVSALAPAASQAAAGRVDFVVGDVRAADVAGQERRIVRTSPVEEGDTIRTGRGRAQIRFNDGAFTSLQPNTELRIDEYRYEAEQAEESRSLLSMFRGGMRKITGLVGRARPDNYRLATPVATIGIRGTEFLVTHDEAGTRLWCGDGDCVLCSAVACSDYSSGEGGSVADPDQPPRDESEPPSQPPAAQGEEFQYAAADDVDDDGRAQVVPDEPAPPVDPGEPEPPPPVDPGEPGPPPPVDPGEPERFADGQFYALAVAFSADDMYGGSIHDLFRAPGDPEDDLTDATFDDQGRLTGYTGTTNFDTPGSWFEANQSVEAEGGGILDAGGVPGVLGWQRWTAGTIEGGDLGTRSLLGHHAVQGIPATDIPTMGSARYDLLGGTTPTFAEGGGIAGTLNTGHLDVYFDMAEVATTLEMTISDVPTTLTTEPHSLGGGGRPGQAFGGFATISADGYCDSSGRVEGFLAGEGASHAGVAYRFYSLPGGDYVLGAAGFERTDAPAADPVPQ